MTMIIAIIRHGELVTARLGVKNWARPKLSSPTTKDDLAVLVRQVASWPPPDAEPTRCGRARSREHFEVWQAI